MNNEEIINNTLCYIEDNLIKKITLEELSNLSFFSQAHLYRVFNELVGSSIMEYIRKRRLLRAAIDIRSTKDNILDIAVKYQFDSQDGFCKAFKKLFGTTPIQYRKSNKENILEEDSFMNNFKNNTTLSTKESYIENDILVKNYIESIKNIDTLTAETILLENAVDKLDDLSIQKLLKQLDITELIAAMKGTSRNIQIRIFKNLSKKVASFMVNELNNFDKNNIEEIVSAQNKVLKKIKAL